MAILQGVTVTGSAHFSGSMFLPIVENTTGLNLAPGQIVFDKENDELVRGHKTEAFKRGLGDKGDKGDAGDRGPQGERGPAGADGADGATGPQGPQGETGPQGPKGDKGDTGATGAAGNSHLSGVKSITFNSKTNQLEITIGETIYKFNPAK